MKKFSIFIVLVGFYAISSFWLAGCANIIPPGGGPKDTIPPRLVLATPKDSALNVRTQKIVLNFDEYVEIKDLQNNLIVSPYPKQNPIIDAKLRTVTIKLKDSLEPNTTYSINFGSSIKDVNESNAFKEFTYIFSTGASLDKNSLSGKVMLAETGKVDTTLIVVLHNNLSDTAVLKKPPRYYARINGDGSFRFNNLPAAKFNVFVLPNDYSKKYDDSTKMFAFLPEPVFVNDSVKSLMLYAYEQSKRKPNNAPSNNNNGNNNNNKSKAPKYTVQLDGGKQDLLNPNFVLEFDKKLSKIETSSIVLYDTNFKSIADVKIFADSTRKKITVQNNQWVSDFAYKLIVPKDAVADSLGNTLAKTDTLKFSAKKEADYGSLKITFTNFNIALHPILQIIRENNIFMSIPITEKVLSRKLFPPGEYELSILYDSNQNGRWDAGNYSLKLQPEIVKKLKKILAIRANWDNESEIVLQ